MIKKNLLIAILVLPLTMSAQSLYDGFQNPPQDARPRVWWHWMDGNITKDGIRKDIEWMHRAGIGGFHLFDAGMGMPPVVEKRIPYMSEEWKDCFGYAMCMADSLGMEVAIASCPGWSNTGGPWVKPDQAMKKLVWREMRVKGGKRLNVRLPEPERNLDWYREAYVMAVRIDKNDKCMEELGARVTSSCGDFTLEQLTDGNLAQATKLPFIGKEPAWIQYQFPKRQTIKALSVADGNVRGEWGAEEAPVMKHLLASDDGVTFQKVCDIPDGGTTLQTIEIPPTTAKYFRIVFDYREMADPWAAFTGNTKVEAAIPLAELTLYPVARINHAEEKAGFATPSDLMAHPTTGNDAIALKDVINLTDKMDSEGRLTWDAPKGNWKILRFGYTLTGKQNHPASREATGLEVSKIDEEAFTGFLEYYLNLYEQIHKMPQYLLIDSYEAGWETWTPLMAQEFERRRGYSLLPWMPVLTGEIIGSAHESEQFLFDWRTTIGELIVECMYENADRIAKKHGLKTYFEAHENGRLYLPDGMEVKSRADIPMAAMWTQIPGLKETNSSLVMAESDIRESASVAHLYGKKLVAAESLTANGMNGGAYSYFPGSLKATADLEMASGVNRFVIHESTHQPLDSLKPGLGLLIFGQWFNRHETWAEQAKAWTDYLARSSFMLQQGQNVADVLWYYGEDDCVTSLYAHQHPQVPPCYNYDYINKEALLDLIAYDGEKLTSKLGASYKLLVIDKSVVHMTEAVKQKIEILRQQGALICDLRAEELGAVLTGLKPDFKTDDMSDLCYVHRTTAEGEIYWVNNRRSKARTIDVDFRVSGMKPTLWHPETGEKEDVSYEMKDDHTVVNLNLEANDAVFVVFSGKAESDKVTLPERSCTLFRHINTPWTVNFDETWGGPKETTFDHLISYTDSEDKSIKYYSGTAVYHNSVLIDESELRPGRYVLDLGKVGCMAEVIVNGLNVGTAWHHPYTLDITSALKTGENKLEIRVVNQWVNRIIGDLQPDNKKKYTYTPQSFYQADSELLPSGLIGPVNIFIYSDI